MKAFHIRRPHATRRPHKAPRQVRGLSLLEVILALAILAGSLAVVGELVRVGADAGLASRELTNAQLWCNSRMEQIAVGLLLPDPIGPIAVEEDPSGTWLYTIASQPVDDQGLLLVVVTVHQDPMQVSRPVSFSLVRWMVDPQLEMSMSAAATTGTTGSSSATTGGF